MGQQKHVKMSLINSLDILPSAEGVFREYMGNEELGIGLNEYILRTLYENEGESEIEDNHIILPNRVERRTFVNNLTDLCIPVGIPIAKVVNLSYGRVAEVIDPTDLDHKDFELNWGKRKIVYGSRV